MATLTAKHNHVAQGFFLITTALILILFWQIISPFILVLVTAGVFAIVFSPVESHLRKYIKGKKLSAFIMTLATFVVVIIPLFVVGILIASQASEITTGATGSVAWLQAFNLRDNTLFQTLPEVVREKVLELDLADVGSWVAQWAGENLGNVLSMTLGLVFNTFIFFICFYYFLADRERIYKLVLDLSPFQDKLDSQIVQRIVATVRNVVFGALIVACVQAILAGIGMTIFGVPGALLWAALIIIAAQVPIFGVSLVMVPAITYLVLTGHPTAGFGLLLYSVVIVGLVDNVLSPTLIGGKTKMHNLLVLLTILGGIRFFGPIGLIIGPTVLAGVMIIIDLYKSGILEKGISRLKA